MRVGIVRTDLGEGVYIADLRSAVQYNPVLEPRGQSRTIRQPTNAELSAVLEAYPAPLVLLGSDTNASVDTSVNDTLRIRVNAQSAYTVIAVTSGATTAKTDIRDDLNAAFLSNSLPFIATIEGTNQIQIATIDPNLGPIAGLDIDLFANGSTLNTPLGFTDGATLTGASTAADLTTLKAAVYPTSTTIDVSESTIIGGLAAGANLSAGDQADLAAAIADLVAPLLYETGHVLQSFKNGILGELVKSTFQPGGTRAGLPAGVGAHVVENDGSTTFTA
jgi:hypothetical protein